MKGNLPEWMFFIIFLTALIVPVSTATWFEGGDYTIHGCSFEQSYCSEKFDTIEVRPNLTAIAIKYSIIENNQSHLGDNFTIHFTFWKANTTRFGNQIVHQEPVLIGSYEGTEREGYRIFDTHYEPDRTNYDFFLRMNYSNLNYGDTSNSNNRELGRFKFILYKIKEGEDAYPPTPVPPPPPMPVEQLNQNGQDLTFTIIRGHPFTYTGMVTQPRIAGNANITRARFWIFGDHYAEVTTVPVNRMNGSFTFSLDRNETENLNSSTYRFFAEYPPEWDFFSINTAQGFINKGLCVCNVLFSLDKARTMSGFESAERFEEWVNGIPLKTPMYKTTITVADSTVLVTPVNPVFTWDSKLHVQPAMTTMAPDTIPATGNTSQRSSVTQKSSKTGLPILMALILGIAYRRYHS